MLVSQSLALGPLSREAPSGQRKETHHDVAAGEENDAAQNHSGRDNIVGHDVAFIEHDGALRVSPGSQFTSMCNPLRVHLTKSTRGWELRSPTE